MGLSALVYLLSFSTGKLNRGLSVIDSYKLLKEGQELTEEEIFLASALGWCIEWLQAYFFVLDDIMDDSHTIRGQPCWFRVPKVGIIAANDKVSLRNHIPRILKNQFRGKPYYIDLLELFNEVEFQTASGQMVDLITTLEGEKDLSKYTLSLHRRIVQYKTAYYSFYLHVACALVMSGENLDNHIDVKNILVDMGIYFQVQVTLDLIASIFPDLFCHSGGYKLIPGFHLFILGSSGLEYNHGLFLFPASKIIISFYF
ncbi:farnesyl pyrophosphate synthase 1-like [Mercurialis annua]|uniref:farnesyl pyrophosphate synthase 1-like n=1 Tax=Mercurialis annua TaxID=3986 RepID=UPI00215ECA3E|nr:farnesyl pyrophosphate synthase 1-like [Mercurialis annua]